MVAVVDVNTVDPSLKVDLAFDAVVELQELEFVVLVDLDFDSCLECFVGLFLKIYNGKYLEP